MSGGLPLRRSLALLGSIVVIALAAAAAGLTPASSGQPTSAQPTSGQPPNTQAPSGYLPAEPLACKPPRRPQRPPLARGLSIYASPNPVTAARQVQIFGRLQGVRHGVRRCGVTIVLWRRFPAQRAFTVVARTRTG
ncbi:MAG: hypothetical protein JO243_13910, partial [Solirubrobacterales bacterium]|nr:hypothetical protein [Solirubrobacterales bacterium]